MHLFYTVMSTDHFSHSGECKFGIPLSLWERPALSRVEAGGRISGRGEV